MLLAEAWTEQVIGLASEAHRNTGLGLLESAYQQCLCVELRRAGVAFNRQVLFPVLDKGEQVGDGVSYQSTLRLTLVVMARLVRATCRGRCWYGCPGQAGP